MASDNVLYSQINFKKVSKKVTKIVFTLDKFLVGIVT